MQFKIFKKYNLIQGISDTSFGSIDPTPADPKLSKKESEKRAIKFLKSLNYKNINSQNLIFAEQIFSSNVRVCKVKDSGKIIKGVDGFISNIPGQTLVIITADCVPILLFDSKNRAIGVLHGGRKCLIKGIIKNAISKMILNFKSKPEDILVGIAPHIRVCHYWLRERTYRNLKKTSLKRYFLKKKSKIYFDLTKLTFDALQKEGIPKENIKDCRICTFCTYKKYFSARKEEEFPRIYPEKNPRFASFIGLKI